MNNPFKREILVGHTSLRTRRPEALVVASVALAVVCAASCADLGKYVWVDDYREATPTVEKPYVIGVGDLIQVRVFNQEQLSARVRVRSDGKISLPLLNDVDAAGYTPVALSQRLESGLRDLVKAASVTVSLEEPKSQNVMVVGEVARPNAYPIEPGSGVLQVLASAGGLTPDASTDRIFVLRQTPTRVRIRFNYEQLRHQEGRAATFRLRGGDVVVVE